jgi:hypothetical protein
MAYVLDCSSFSVIHWTIAALSAALAQGGNEMHFKSTFQNATAYALLFMSGALLFACSVPRPMGPNSYKKTVDHPNLRRYQDPVINNIIITAWENVQKRNYETAALDFERLSGKGYDDDDILFGAGIAFYRHHDLKKARIFAGRALEKNPGHFEALFLRASVLKDVNLVRESDADLRALLSMSYTRPLICGYYFNENDLATQTHFSLRQQQAAKMIGR